MPTLTRNGQVKDVVIQENLSTTTLTVNPGDEIRWINRRQGAARVIFLDPVMGKAANRRIEIVLYPKEFTEIVRQSP